LKLLDELVFAKLLRPSV